MADIVDSRVRSRMMSRVRGKNTEPERTVRRHLHRAGLRFLLHDRRLPGQPDIVLPRFRTAVEVRGCFWHRHPRCRFATTPASNVAFWHAKFSANVERDARNLSAMQALGWRVFVIWECEVSDDWRLDQLVDAIRD